jgi:hypothetical protein
MEKLEGTLAEEVLAAPAPTPICSIVIAQKGCKATPQRQLIISRKLAKQPY